MKKLLLVFGILFILTSFTIQKTEVYICMSKGSKAYHLKKDCSGLKKCKKKIKKITLKKAENVGRTFCKLEKKHKSSKKKK